MGAGNPVAVPVKPADAHLWRERLAWHFRSFCRGGSWTPEELLGDVETGERQLWVVWRDEPLGAVLTLVMGQPVRRLVLTHAAGRDRGLWLPLWPVLEAYARQRGCDVIEAVCRSGWERDLKRVGMRKAHVIMEKRLA